MNAFGAGNGGAHGRVSSCSWEVVFRDGKSRLRKERARPPPGAPGLSQECHNNSDIRETLGQCRHNAWRACATDILFSLDVEIGDAATRDLRCAAAPAENLTIRGVTGQFLRGSFAEQGYPSVGTNSSMANKPFRLGFRERDIPAWASRYSFTAGDAVPVGMAPPIVERGYLTRDEFRTLCHWKSPRTRPLVHSNASDLVRIATGTALAHSDEETKIGVLRLLRGVSWPTASVILHFCDHRPYPILDYRALWSLGYAKPPVYTFGFWLAYVEFIRDLATRTGHSMRVIDGALWQYSKERQ